MPLLLPYSHLGLANFFPCRHDATVRSARRTSENSPSTHSGELTLGTWLLQQPTHRDHGPTEHRHRRIHPSSTSEGPEVLPVLTSHQASSPSRAPSPYPLLPLSPGYPLSYLLVYPTNPTMVAVFGV